MKKIIIAYILGLAFLAGFGFELGRAETMICVCPESQFVRIRTAPKKSASEWGRLHYGDKVEVQGVENGFIRFSYDGRNSYAAVQYFEIPTAGKYKVEANGRVAKRAKPDGKRTGWLNPGVKIDVLAWQFGADGTKWAKVYGGAYIKAEYLIAA